MVESDLVVSLSDSPAEERLWRDVWDVISTHSGYFSRQYITDLMTAAIASLKFRAW